MPEFTRPMDVMIKLRAMKPFQLIIACICLLFVHSESALANLEGLLTYQRLQMPEARREAIGIDINRYDTADDLFETLRQQFDLPLEENNPRVQEKMQWYFRHSDHLVQTLKRASPWLYFISEQAKKRHLPAELVLLPVIESAYDPFAKNASSGAAGLWQIKIARDYGLRQNWWYDGRFDVVTSTIAALDHLAALHHFFSNDWLLALAAYDAGEGTVLAAIHKNRREGKKTDYWSLNLPRETEEYVPRLLALAAIIGHPEFYPVNFPIVRNAPYLAEVKTDTQLDLKLAANLAHMSLVQLKKLNPGYNRPATDPKGPFHLILPIENVAQFTDGLSQLAGWPRTQWIRYRIQPNESWTAIANRFHTSPELLKRKNPTLPTILKGGEEIVVADTRTLETIQKIYSPKTYSVKPGDTLYIVRQGDTLPKIAKHFHIAKNDIMTLDKNNPGMLYPGENLLLPTHLPPKAIFPPSKEVFYKVQANETVEDIARKFHIHPAMLRLVNLLENHQLKSGDQLIIPGRLNDA